MDSSILNSEPLIIELDCPPGMIRPDSILPSVLVDTGLTSDDFKIISKSFGCWEFECDKSKEQLYIANEAKIGKKIQDLFHSGRIRFGSW